MSGTVNDVSSAGGIIAIIGRAVQQIAGQLSGSDLNSLISTLQGAVGDQFTPGNTALLAGLGATTAGGAALAFGAPAAHVAGLEAGDFIGRAARIPGAISGSTSFSQAAGKTANLLLGEGPTANLARQGATYAGLRSGDPAWDDFASGPGVNTGLNQAQKKKISLAREAGASDQAIALMEFQMIQDNIEELINAITNSNKKNHDARMAIARNLA